MATPPLTLPRSEALVPGHGLACGCTLCRTLEDGIRAKALLTEIARAWRAYDDATDRDAAGEKGVDWEAAFEKVDALLGEAGAWLLDGKASP